MISSTQETAFRPSLPMAPDTLGVREALPDPSLDRLARLAAHLLHVSVALLIVLDEDSDLRRGQVGLHGPSASRRWASLAQSALGRAVAKGQRLVVGDVGADPRFEDDREIVALGGVACLCVPFRTATGRQAGGFIVVDGKARRWRPEEIEILDDLAEAAAAEINLRGDAAKLKEVEAALREIGERYRVFTDVSSQLVWFGTAEGFITDCNQLWHDYTGLTPEQTVGDGWLDAVHPDDRPGALAAWKRAVAERGEYELEFRIWRARDATYRWHLDRGIPVCDGAGRVVRWMGMAIDIHERKEAEQALRQGEQRYRSLVEATAAIVWNTPESGEFESEQPDWSRFTGQTYEQLSGWGWVDAVHPVDRLETSRVWSQAVATRRPYEVEHRLRRHDGEYRHMSVRGVPISADDGSIREWIGVHNDITDRKQAEASLAYQARHDELTGLPNRGELIRSIEAAAAAARGTDRRCALLLLDLDRFKEINDTFGHHYGDEVLKELNPRLLRAVRDTDLVARLGGDEFGILLDDADEKAALAVADRILAGMSSAITVEGRTLDVGTSIGIALYPDHGTDATSLLRRADTAMYAAKRGRAGRVVYAEGLSNCTPERLAMSGELRRGIEDGQLLLHYQPKVDLATGRASGVEALVRWLHPREGLLDPGRFIPLAEETGLIRPLGLWALNTAMLQCRDWHEAGMEVGIAVNLSPENLHDDQLIGRIGGLIESSGARPGWLTLEITETAMMREPDRVKVVLTRLHAMGVRVSIDDFGTGYSSLAFLKELPVDEVKIDRSFVKDMMVNDRDACIVRSVIDLGHNLGLKVVAEGVEDQATADKLASLGCDSAQGYHFSRPLPSSDFARWLNGAGRPTPKA